ncbi:MAG: F0F1 ATP synthase subunit A [Clostridium sp. CAG:217_53_7]|nr:MAG: F0F1 ATP synthase subunit A [Clostridium sp. CAG:217_53_7]
MLLKTDVASKLIEELNTETVFSLFGGKLKIDEGTVVSWIIMAVFLIAGILLTRGLKVEGKLSKRQLLIEMCVDKMRTFFHSVMGPDGDRYIPWMMTVAVYIGACNMCGIFGFKSPTKELNVTVGLALTSIILVQYAGIHKKGTKGWLKSFANMSLCFRLFGNIIGAFIIMKLIEAVVPVAIPVALSLYFDIFDGFIQAYVFVFLTSLYIQEAIED